MPKKVYKQKIVKRKDVKSTWDKEYDNPEFFSMSEKAASELVKFARAMRKDYGDDYFACSTVLDVGCGNGRNIIFLAQNYGAKGIGFDIASTAIEKAKKIALGLPLKFFTQPIAPTLPAADASIDVVLDVMASHCLKESERELYMKEILRVTAPGAMFFLKTFLWEGDQHAKRLCEQYPGGEPYAYIHPSLGVFEHVWTEKELTEYVEPFGEIEFIYRSQGYQHWGGQPYKRRYIIMYIKRR